MAGPMDARTLVAGFVEKKMAGFFLLPALKGSHCGVEVVRLHDGKVVYEKNAEVLFCPASLTKLFTSAAALKTLKPEYSFKTRVYGDGKLLKGVYKGNLYIKGYGDPTLVEERVFKIAKTLREKGISIVQGNLYLDDSFFDGEKYGEGWGKLTHSWYHAPLCALSVNFNTVCEVKSWFAIRCEPLDYAGRIFREVFQDAGIRIEGKETERRVVPQKAVQLLEEESGRLSSIIVEMNKLSSNFIAEQVLKTMGAEILGPPGTAEKGLRIVKDFLRTELDVPEDKYTLVDGSGLSQLNLVSPSLVIKLLLAVDRDFEIGSEFKASLKIAGAEGGKAAHFKQPDVKRKLKIKTGHLDRINNLAGYACTKDGEILAFVIFINDCKASRSAADRSMERFAGILTDLTGPEIEEGVLLYTLNENSTFTKSQGNR
jgi:D-alanyl-D-alanine carboxypeptidase/D-alanyl-D-alanine-endopeptidase (penicillin-binding protein 4)